MTCATCGAERCVNPSFCRACRKADAKYRRTPDVERVHAPLDDFSTPQVTIEAIMCCVRERGLGALKEPANVERLLRCDEVARDQINKRIERLIGQSRLPR
jgi:hypothetical protein